MSIWRAGACLAAILAGCQAAPGDAPFPPHDLRVDRERSPIGMDAPRPMLAWKLTEHGRGITQQAYQVVASRDPGDGTFPPEWDSGKVFSARPAGVPYGGPPLASRTRYRWKVRIWEAGGEGTPWSAEDWFETGLLEPGDWSATWVARDTPPAADVDARTSLLRKDFTVRKEIRRARIYSTALGDYEIHLNGVRVGDEYFAPGWTDYARRLQVQVHDVTALLKPGANTLGAILSTGWYAGKIGALGKNAYGSDRPGLLAQLEVTYRDGTTETVVTDGTWKVTRGPFLSADHQDGETYDARAEERGWSTPGFDDSSWQPAVRKTDVPAGVSLSSRAGPPVRRTQELASGAVRRASPAVQIVDMGQNMVGVVRLRVRGAPAGLEIQLRFGEALGPDGSLYTENLRSARATDRYVTSGREIEEWSPRFTFHGFRYVEVTGYPGDLPQDAIAGLVLGTDAPITGRFTTSNPLLDRLQSNITWSQRGNFLSIPSDCPQRDERLGWTGDISVFAPTAAFNMDVSRFLGKKWLADLRDAEASAGGIPDFAPTVGNAPLRRDIQWGSAVVQVPYTVWQIYGDLGVIEENWGTMVRAMEVWRSAAGDGHILAEESYGDWLAPEESSIEVLDTAWLKHDADMMGEMALATGRPTEASEYAALSDAVKRAFVGKYVRGDGRVIGPPATGGGPALESQTQYVLAIAWDLLPDELRSAAASWLRSRLEDRGWHLATGFQGTPELLNALSSSGQPDAAYRVLEQDTQPSWLYEVKAGATTTWERWDSLLPDGTVNRAVSGMNSLNHYALGAVGNWMYRNVLGIQQDPQGVGYQRSIVRPQPGGDVEAASGAVESVHGTLAVDWRLDGDRFQLDVVIPPNTTAEVHVPVTGPSIVSEGMFLADQAPGVAYLRTEGGRAVYAVGSGIYSFRSEPGQGGPGTRIVLSNRGPRTKDAGAAAKGGARVDPP